MQLDEILILDSSVPLLGTQRKRKRDFTGNRESISLIISSGRCDFIEETVVMRLGIRHCSLLFPYFNFFHQLLEHSYQKGFFFWG